MYSTQLSAIGAIVLILSLGSIALFLLITSMTSVLPIYQKEKQRNITFALFLIGVSALAFIWDPAPYYDSYRHFAHLNKIRASSVSFGEFLFNSTISRSVGGEYETLFAFNVLRYIIARFTQDNHLLQGICASCIYVVFYYITTDWFKRQNISEKYLLTIVILCFTFIPYLMAVSGIRTGFAMAVAAFAVYRRIVQNKKYAEYILLSIIAITFHQISIAPVAIALLCPCLKKKWFVWVFFLVGILIEPAVQLCAQINSSFLNKIAHLYYYYQEHAVTADKLSFYVTILFSIFLLCTFPDFDIGNEQESKTLIWQFVKLYLVWLLVCATIRSTNVLLRSAYFLAPFSSIILTPYIKGKTGTWRRTILKLAFVGLLIACCVIATQSVLLFFAQMF